ncbi:MAG: GNAT family N-acetyltransferase [Herpetosiphonaceae bacterium]|nr:GNAT family N-acetyltransferase [Herpetosiphonaceae bacterium]
MSISYRQTLEDVDWEAMKAILQTDDFDNGRTPAQLATSFANSAGTCIVYADEQIIGTARVLSDGVCNAYVVDVWTLSSYRNQGIGRRMLDLLLADLQGQHVYLFTDDMVEFYQRVGFVQRGTGMERVVGEWLVNQPDRGHREQGIDE